MTYESNLRQLLDYSFGTADFYSRGLTALGWRCTDIIANYPQLNKLHAIERIVDRIDAINPDVVFLQDLSTFTTFELDHFKRKGYMFAGQCSCALPNPELWHRIDVIFTSLPYYVRSSQWEFLPLAFDPIVLERVGPIERDLGCIFVGGIGWQWVSSRDLLDMARLNIPSMYFYGYGYEAAPGLDWQGYAWGLDYYRLLLRSKIVLNRHGAISKQYSNNLRLFEATGCGALVLTEESHNLRDFFADDEIVSYRSPSDAVEKINYYLAHDDERAAIAAKGQQRTLTDHTYANRLTKVSNVLHARLNSELMHHPV
jgi:hypothetical protein